MSTTDLHERLALLVDHEPPLPDYVSVALSLGGRRRHVRRAIEGVAAVAVVGALAVALPVSPVHRAVVAASGPIPCAKADLAVVLTPDNVLRITNRSDRTCRFAGRYPIAVWGLSMYDRTLITGSLPAGATYVLTYRASGAHDCPILHRWGGTLLHVPAPPPDPTTTQASVEHRWFRVTITRDQAQAFACLVFARDPARIEG